jgi:hypothetical protein
MDTYTYTATFEHGAATGEIQASSPKHAKEKVTAMYQGLQYDTQDANGNPILKATVVTKVKVIPVKD